MKYWSLLFLIVIGTSCRVIPQGVFADQKMGIAPDYSLLANWAAHPDKADAADSIQISRPLMKVIFRQISFLFIRRPTLVKREKTNGMPVSMMPHLMPGQMKRRSFFRPVFSIRPAGYLRHATGRRITRLISPAMILLPPGRSNWLIRTLMRHSAITWNTGIMAGPS